MSTESIGNRNRERELEEELMRSEQRTRLLIQAIPLAFLIVDGKGSILRINQQASELLGWQPEEVVGKKLIDMLESPAVSFPLAPDFRKTGFESSMRNREDQPVFVEVAISEMSRENDAWLVSLKDISERKKIETFKQSIVQMLSHDLRSPLSSLSIFLDLLVEERLGEVPDKVKAKGISARSSCARLLNLVEDLLRVEKLAANRLELEHRLVLSDSILDAATSSITELANEKRVELEIEGRDIEVWCDEDRLVQVLVNFLSNALKFSPESETITIAARELDDGVEFSVNDRGPGIPDAEFELVFERFFQCSNNQTGKGFGLGLAICREIVIAHNGSVGVRKNGDKGASFWFRIPAEPR